VIKKREFLPGFMKALTGWIAPGKRYDFLVSAAYGMLSCSGIRKKVAFQNMDIAFPDKQKAWKKDVLKRHYKHLAISLGEYFLLLQNPENIAQYMRPEKDPLFLDELRDNKKGAVILTAHMGNWEMLAAWLAHRGYPMHAIVRRHEEEETEAFVEQARNRVGLRTISKSENMIKVLRMLRKGAFVGILGDQYAGPEGIPLRFFGRETSCYFGAAALALMAKVPLVPVISWRETPFSHLVRICPPLFPFPGDEEGEKTFSREKRIEDLTEKGNRLLENWIREHPEQWLWLHRRYR